MYFSFCSCIVHVWSPFECEFLSFNISSNPAWALGCAETSMFGDLTLLSLYVVVLPFCIGIWSKGWWVGVGYWSGEREWKLLLNNHGMYLQCRLIFAKIADYDIIKTRDFQKSNFKTWKWIFISFLKCFLYYNTFVIVSVISL